MNSIRDKFYYSEIFEENKISEIQSSLNSLVENTVRFQLKPIASSEYREMMEEKIKLLRNFPRYFDTNCFQLIPGVHFLKNLDKNIVKLSSSLFFFAFDQNFHKFSQKTIRHGIMLIIEWAPMKSLSNVLVEKDRVSVRVNYHQTGGSSGGLIGLR